MTSEEYKEEETLLNKMYAGKKVRVQFDSTTVYRVKAEMQNCKGFHPYHYIPYLHMMEGVILRVKKTCYRQEGVNQFIVEFQNCSIKSAPLQKEDLILLEQSL